MFMEERHREISEALQANGKITIAEIAGKYGISDESARRDLRLLEQKGICRRTHGGALALGQVGIRPPADRDFDNMPIFENYREIARTAVPENQGKRYRISDQRLLWPYHAFFSAQRHSLYADRKFR